MIENPDNYIPALRKPERAGSPCTRKLACIFIGTLQLIDSHGVQIRRGAEPRNAPYIWLIEVLDMVAPRSDHVRESGIRRAKIYPRGAAQSQDTR